MASAVTAPRVRGRRQAPEKAEQLQIRRLFESCGFVVYNLSQARASQQTPGLPDLWLVNPATGDALWFECKAPKPNGTAKPLHPEQEQFRDECLATGVNHAWGVLADAMAWLERWGYGTVCANGFVRGRPVARRMP
jgi:hypothetical protein